MQIIAFQTELRPALLTVVGNVDYQEFKSSLQRIDKLLRTGDIESGFVRRCLQEVERVRGDVAQRHGLQPLQLRQKAVTRIAEHAVLALRCNIARSLVGGSYREFSRRLADSPLLQWFCGLSRLDIVRVPSKSTLERYGKLVPEQIVREVVDHLNRMAVAAPGPDGQCLGLEQSLSLELLLLDTTCVPANIHFPVDWVLLRDAARTLIKGVSLIRRHGLRHRMGEPSAFMRQVNRLCIEMTHSRRRADGRKHRKRILRLLKALLGTIDGHARRHRELLASDWQQTDLRAGEVQQILARLDGVRQQLPVAIKQAHERIIGGRQVANKDKLLSLYEPDVHVVVRGKAGAEVEFGNTLLLAEQSDGVIVDWMFVQDQAPSDSKFVTASLARFGAVFGGRQPGAFVTDRGFDSPANREQVTQAGIYNAICPKSVSGLRERMQDKRFAELQSRRGQTEGRVGIFKNCFLGRPCRSKGFIHRDLNITWSVLAHNLWVIARLPVAAQERERRRDAA
jgi:hypothetical protein